MEQIFPEHSNKISIFSLARLLYNSDLRACLNFVYGKDESDTRNWGAIKINALNSTFIILSVLGDDESYIYDMSDNSGEDGLCGFIENALQCHKNDYAYICTGSWISLDILTEIVMKMKSDQSIYVMLRTDVGIFGITKTTKFNTELLLLNYNGGSVSILDLSSYAQVQDIMGWLKKGLGIDNQTSVFLKDKNEISYQSITNDMKNILNKIRYNRLQAKEEKLHAKMKKLIIRFLRQNGNRISIIPDYDEEDFEFPVTMPFYGKHDNPSISITDVYLDTDTYINTDYIKVDGVNDNGGFKEKGYEVYPEHYAWILSFIHAALGLEKTGPLQMFWKSVLHCFGYGRRNTPVNS